LIRRTLGAAALLGVATAAGYAAVLRPRHLRWGATDDEVASDFPGDGLLPAPRLLTTRAVTIGAPVAAVWPWIVQLGADRGGLYSYDRLERLIGANMRNADRIVPEWQTLAVGDTVPLAPGGAMGLEVVELEPNRTLVLHARVDPSAPGRLLGPDDPTPPAWFDVCWSWRLTEIDDRTTRLAVRFSMDWDDRLASWVAWRVFTEPAHFVMERKMLLGIRERAERLSDGS
jgi:hypothetical protein